MTNADVDRLLADLCRADATLDDARAEVRAAGDKLQAAGRRWDELARRVVPIIKANPGRLCKGRKWDGHGYVDCGVYLDEHGCVAIQPIADAYDLAVPMVADAATAIGPDDDDDELGPVSVQPLPYLDGLARFAAVRPRDVADVPADVLAYVNDVDGDAGDVLDSRGNVTPDVRTEAMAAAQCLRDAVGSTDPITRLAVAMAAEDEYGDDGEDELARLMGVEDDVDWFGSSECPTVFGDEVTESGETIAAGR